MVAGPRSSIRPGRPKLSATRSSVSRRPPWLTHKPQQRERHSAFHDDWIQSCATAIVSAFQRGENVQSRVRCQTCRQGPRGSRPPGNVPGSTYRAPASADNLDNLWFQTIVDFVKSCALDPILRSRRRWIILRQLAWSVLLELLRADVHPLGLGREASCRGEDPPVT
jgi:hypothetical protein